MNGHTLTAAGEAVRGLTVRQPYATLLATGTKTVENRTWNHAHRGDVLIHAASKFHDRYPKGSTFPLLAGQHDVKSPSRTVQGLDPTGYTLHVPVEALPRRVIVARAILTDIHRAPEHLESIPTMGSQPNLYCGCSHHSGAEVGEGLFHHVYEDPTPLDQTVPWAAGSLGYWHPTEQLTQAVWEQITRQAESRVA